MLKPSTSSSPSPHQQHKEKKKLRRNGGLGLLACSALSHVGLASSSAAFAVEILYGIPGILGLCGAVLFLSAAPQLWTKSESMPLDAYLEAWLQNKGFSYEVTQAAEEKRYTFEGRTGPVEVRFGPIAASLPGGPPKAAFESESPHCAALCLRADLHFEDGQSCGIWWGQLQTLLESPVDSGSTSRPERAPIPTMAARAAGAYFLDMTSHRLLHARSSYRSVALPGLDDLPKLAFRREMLRDWELRVSPDSGEVWYLGADPFPEELLCRVEDLEQWIFEQSRTLPIPPAKRWAQALLKNPPLPPGATSFSLLHALHHHGADSPEWQAVTELWRDRDDEEERLWLAIFDADHSDLHSQLKDDKEQWDAPKISALFFDQIVLEHCVVDDPALWRAAHGLLQALSHELADDFERALKRGDLMRAKAALLYRHEPERFHALADDSPELLGALSVSILDGSIGKLSVSPEQGLLSVDDPAPKPEPKNKPGSDI